MKLSAAQWRRVHVVAAILWVVPGVAIAWVICFKLPPEVAAFAILCVSLYANMVGHWGAYQAVRAEQVADPTQPNPD
jgi:uncharacterized membrane protein